MVGKHMIDSWVATDQVRALSSGEAELYGLVDGAARGLQTKHMMEEIMDAWQVELQCDSTAAVGMACRTGVSSRTRHIQTKWLWIQDAVRDKK
eukprot:6486824-Amphidinium_carterae.1